MVMHRVKVLEDLLVLNLELAHKSITLVVDHHLFVFGNLNLQRVFDLDNIMNMALII